MIHSESERIASDLAALLSSVPYNRYLLPRIREDLRAAKLKALTGATLEEREVGRVEWAYIANRFGDSEMNVDGSIRRDAIARKVINPDTVQPIQP